MPPSSASAPPAPCVGLIGCGRMGSAIARGLLDRWPDARLRVHDVHPAAAAALRDRAPDRVTLCDAPADALQHASAVVLAVKPHQLLALLKRLTPAPPTLLISVAAGLRVAPLRAAASPHRVARVMPNTPAMVGEGVTGVLLDAPLDEEDRALVCRLFAPLGEVVTVDDEARLDVLTALAGSGPAFVALIAEALADAAVCEGLPRDDAARVARLMMRGTTALLAHQHPAALKDGVGSPGGTTMAGVVAAERAGLRAAVIAAVRAAAARSRQMADG